MRIDRFALLTITLVLVFAVLQKAAAILLPFVLALFTVIAFQPVLAFLERKRVPRILSITAISVIVLLALSLTFIIVSQTVVEIVDQKDTLVEHFSNRIRDGIFRLEYKTHLEIYPTYLRSMRSFARENFSSEAIIDSIGSFAKILTKIAGSFVMYAIFFVFILAGFSNYKKFIWFVGGSEHGDKLLDSFETVMRSIGSYIVVKFVVSFATGLVFWLICAIFGIPFSMFWGFLAFLFNFIPNIGSIAATIIPVLVAVAYLKFSALVIFATLLTCTQLLFGNIIEPIIQGNRLRLNTLTVLLGLVLWGYIWGIAGMVLALPLMVLMKTIFERIPHTEMIARAMSALPSDAPKNTSE